MAVSWNGRTIRPEVMDQPGLSRQAHHLALRGLQRINFFSASDRIVWRPLRKLLTEGQRENVRILDIASGAGDIPIALWRRAHREGFRVQIDGCDRSEVAVKYAHSKAGVNGADVRFFELDVLHEKIPHDYDAIICSLFLHHLENDAAVCLMQSMAQAAERMVLINDLVRSPVGKALAYVGTRALSTSSVVHTDGPRSVDGAFTMAEARQLADRAGLRGVTIEKRWPCRFLLKWVRD